MKAKPASFLILTRPLRWLVWVCCASLLGVSLMAPVSAAVMAGSGQMVAAADAMDHLAAQDESAPVSVGAHEHAVASAHCDNGSACAQDIGCETICLHCSACGVSVSPSPGAALSAASVRRPVIVLPAGCTAALPTHRSSPPYRPPIARR